MVEIARLLDELMALVIKMLTVHPCLFVSGQGSG